MTESIVKLSALKKGDRFILPNDTCVYYKAYYSYYRRAWICLHHGGSKIQRAFEPSLPVIFLWHA